MNNKPINFWLNPTHDEAIRSISHKYFLKSRSALVGAFLAQESHLKFHHLQKILDDQTLVNNTKDHIYTSVYLDVATYSLIKNISKEHNISMSFFLSNLVNFYISNLELFDPFNIYQ